MVCLYWDTHLLGAWGSKSPFSKLDTVNPFPLVIVLIDPEIRKVFWHYSSGGTAFDEGVLGEI